MHVIVIVRLQSRVNNTVRREAGAFLRHPRRRRRVFALVPPPPVPIPLATPFLPRDTIRLHFRPRTLDGQSLVLGGEGRVNRMNPVVQMRIWVCKINIIFSIPYNCFIRRIFVVWIVVNWLYLRAVFLRDKNSDIILSFRKTGGRRRRSYIEEESLWEERAIKWD